MGAAKGGAISVLVWAVVMAKAQNMSRETPFSHPDEGPCDMSAQPKGSDTFTVCQPSERTGSYGIRYWKMSASDMCSALRDQTCITVDHMHCNGDPTLCLKWGRDAYAGRVVLPEGVEVFGWGSWSCDGPFRFTKSGPTVEPYEFWDYSWRVDAFRIRLIDGYTCSPGAHPPVQIKSSADCVPDEVIGRWTYWFSQQSGDTTKKSISIGLKTTQTEQDQQTYTSSLMGKVSFGVKVGSAFAIGDSTNYELSAEQSVAIAHSTSSALEHHTVVTEEKTLTGAGTYWQFVMYVNNSGTCQSRTSEALLPEYLHTENSQEPPCCAPGLFKNIDQPAGECLDGAPRLCRSSPRPSELIV